ncbi:PTS fructose transporter subunit IIC [Anaerococcus sp. AGMB09787]|uniref:PTS fructose transporter subunit IIC n=1 Tax=Anaerococcus sp. AGMB09787 TaxID=2922869 RepID=UPI001FB023BC|nr:PTS fructose transporter subunit IIC [Anaerococcus sp. AGMB09787]
MKNINFRKHLMTAIAFMIPYVASTGMLMVIGNLLGGSVIELTGETISIPNLFSTLGATALGFIPIIISTGISYSIANRAGIAPGFTMGLLCKFNGYGFLGGIVTGFLVGFLTSFILKTAKLPKWLQGLLPQLILPLIVTIVTGLVMQYAVGIPIIALTNFINNLLESMRNNQGQSVLFGALVGVLSSIDYGGPINKVVFTFGAGALSEGYGGIIANLIQASMIAPFGLTIGYFISKLRGKSSLFSNKEVDSLKTAFVMGCFQITEGSFPIILNDLIRITICTGIGSAVSGALIGYWGVESSVPSGGLIAMPGFNNPFLWLLALIIGSLVFAIVLQFLKRDSKKMNTLPTEDIKSIEEDEIENLTFS